MTEGYDLVVIGSGVAGKVLSWTLASQGKRVAVIERKYVGGSCPNIACLPSKNVIHSAKIASYIQEFGGRIDITTVRNRKRKMVEGLVEAHLQKYRGSGAELVMGTARFVAPRIVEVTLNAGGKRTLRGENVIINIGSQARIDDIPGLRDARPLTHVEALELDRVPDRLVVLGGATWALNSRRRSVASSRRQSRNSSVMRGSRYGPGSRYNRSEDDPANRSAWTHRPA
jgi:pyruvate/2-oxoglutarate dehydrogenase complex dihydrolipoamide dehydrogenase (E3) component